MIWISAVSGKLDLPLLARAGVREVLLGAAELSRYGTLNQTELMECAAEARRLGLRAVLEWDILMTQPDFEKACESLKKIDIRAFDAIRVQDPGALEYALQNFSGLPVQLVLETGNHNLEAVLNWCRYAGKRLERVALSSQITAKILSEWIRKIPVPVEVLGLGPVLILYTPRHLLSNQKPEAEAAETLRATASSEESFHSGFRVTENRHGTFVFLGKDYCLADKIEELHAMGMGALRADLRLHEKTGVLEDVAGIFSAKTNLEAAEILKNYSQAVTHCFFKSNNTDVIFKRLKNEHLGRQDDGFLGEVVDLVKDHCLVVHVRGRKQKLRQGQTVKVISPEGLEYERKIETLRDLDKKDIAEAGYGDFALIPFVRACPAKSAVYLV